MGGDTSAKAIRSEAKFIMVAAEMGWEISKPVHHAQGYDFVIRRSTRRVWETIQVKTAFGGYSGRKKRPCRVVSLRRCNEKGARPYKDGEFDYLFVVDDENCWMIPWEIVSHIRSQIMVSGKKYERFRLF